MQRYISLKWQAVVVVSLVLLLSGCLFAYLGNQGLRQAYARDLERQYRDRRQAIGAALLASQQQLVRLANHLQGVAVELGARGNDSSLLQVLDIHWGQLSFDWGVEGLAVVDRDMNLQGEWGQTVIASKVPRDWLQEVLQSEQPLTRVWCPSDCIASAMVPAIIDGDELGAMYLSSSLADAVLQFQANTRVHVGILASGAQPTSERALISDWKQTVMALTGMPESLQVLRQLAAQNSMAKLAPGRPQRISLDGATYEVRLTPLGDDTLVDQITLVFVDDISEGLVKLDRTVATYLAVTFAVALAVEVVLLMLLWRPMGRLQLVSTHLPRLAGSARESATQRLSEMRSGSLVRNEIDLLHDAAMLLSTTLENLDVEVRLRSEHLTKRRQELLEERNFVTRLLNNVHVVILTQNTESEMLLVNAEGRNLLGLSDRRGGGDRFSAHLAEMDREEFNHGIDRLLIREISEFRQEIDFYCDEDKYVAMEWYHSCLPDDDQGRATILSVGLDLTERKKAEANLAWLADHDPLTEIYNRRRFQGEFQRALKTASRSAASGAVIIFDIDQFKSINDTGGHLVGDIILQQVAWKLRKEIRETDIIARLGGDEFAILLENIAADGVETFAGKLCEQVLAMEIEAEGTTYRISISAGVALYPDHGLSMELLMANADFAMYAAKSLTNARNSWQLSTGSGTEQSALREAIAWKSRIQDALENDGFVLYFQPIMNIRERRISHYEALVRMLDDNGDVIAPGNFIPIAETTGLIYEIDLRVVELAVRAMQKFRADDRDINLAVNISARAVLNHEYIDYVDRMVTEAGLRQRSFIFELTETSAVEDVAHAAQVIDEFRRRGFRFSLDDFGVGFSSWYYLRQLAVDYVKLDGSFVKNMSTIFEDRLFVKSINDVVQGLGKQSIAEFVGDAETLQMLTRLGVNYAQGFYIGKPQPGLLPDEFVLGTLR